MQTRFVIFRHGETDWNLQHLIQGSSDIALNENGRKQAAAGVDAVKDFSFDLAFASDYCRAVETARIVLREKALTIRTDCRLREWDLGDWEGLYAPDFFKKYPETVPTLLDGVGELTPPNGESTAQLRQRIHSFFNETAERHPGKTIFICSHGAALRCIRELACGCIQEGQFVPLSDNLARNEIVYDHCKKAWGLIEWNYRGHLGTVPVNKAI